MKITKIRYGEKITEPGVYEMPNDWYHADCADGPSFSASMAIALYQECPRVMWFDSYLNPDRPSDSVTRFDLGTAAHAAALEENWQGLVVAVDKNTPAARKRYLRNEARESGAVCLTPDQMARVLVMRDALWADDECHRLTTEGQNELSYFVKDEDTGIWLKSRPDVRIRIDDKVCVRDYKTTSGSVHPRSIAMKVHDGGWFIQAASQLDIITRVEGAPPHDFAWICQENAPPHLVNIVTPSVITLDWGLIVWRAMIRDFFACLTADNWPAYERGAEIDLPRGIEMALEERKDRGDFGSPGRVGEDYARRIFGVGNNPETLKAY
jgi:hypothetical protein